MDEACGGYETISADDVMEVDDEGQQTEGNQAHGTEYVKSLKHEIAIYRKEMKVMERDKLEFFDQVHKQTDLYLETQQLKTEEKELAEQITKLDLLIDDKMEPNKFDDEIITSLAFKAIYEEEKRVRALYISNNNMPTHIRLHSWRGIVSERPHLSWTIDKVSRGKTYEKKFYVMEHMLDCKAVVKLPIKVSDPNEPFLRVFVKYDDQEPGVMPSMVAVINRTKSDQGRVERLHFDGSSYPMWEPVAKKNARFKIELYCELPWSAAHVQSKNGVLYWTVENLSELVRRDDGVLYSPYFLTDKENGHLMQAVLRVSAEENKMRLQVVRRCSLLDPDGSSYVLRMTVFTPTYPAIKWIKTRRSDLMEGVHFVLGNVEELVVNDILLCKVVVVRAPTKG